MMKTEEIRSVLIKTTEIFLHHYFLGLIAGPLFPISKKWQYKSIVAWPQTEKDRTIPKLTPLEHMNLQFIFIKQLSVYFEN